MSNKEWKPASSPADLAVRLENGELFDHHGNKVWCDPSEPNPYRYNHGALGVCWEDYAKMTQWVEPVPEWTKQLDKLSVWCRASNKSLEQASAKKTASLIKNYDLGSEYPYVDTNGLRWKFAIPIENLTEPKA